MRAGLPVIVLAAVFGRTLIDMPAPRGEIRPGAVALHRYAYARVYPRYTYISPPVFWPYAYGYGYGYGYGWYAYGCYGYGWAWPCWGWGWNRGWGWGWSTGSCR